MDCNITKAARSRHDVEIDIIVALNGTVIGGINATIATGAGVNGSLSETFPYINSSVSVGSSIISVSDGLAMRFPFQNATITVSNTTLEVNTPESAQCPYTIVSSITLSNRTADVDVVVGICGQILPVCNAQSNVTCPPEVVCNLTVSRDPDGGVNIHVSGDSATLLNITIPESKLRNETAVLQSNSTIFAVSHVNDSIVLIATEYMCPFCSAEFLIGNASEFDSGVNNSRNDCSMTVECNVTAIRNASGSIAIHVITVDGILLHTSLQDSALSNNGTSISVNSSLQLTLMRENSTTLVLAATQNMCPFCRAHALIINDTGSSNISFTSTCPQAVLCNMTATLNAAGDVAIEVIAANVTLLNTSLSGSVLSSNTTLLSLNDSLQFAFTSENQVIRLYVMANMCSICNATSHLTYANQSTANLSNSYCPAPVVCNVTVSRNASGSTAIQVFTANMTLLNSSFLDSALDGSGTILQGNNSAVHIALHRATGVIEVFAVKNNCSYCNSSFSLRINGSQCPQAVLCNMTATLNAAGDVAIQVIAANVTLLNTSLSGSVLSSNTTLLSLNDSLQFAFTSENQVIRLYVMANMCSICNATSHLTYANQSTANLSNSYCPAPVVCNVTVSRNASGSTAIQVFTANMTLLNSSFLDSALDGNGTILQGNNSAVHIALHRATGVIEVFAVKNNCSYCNSSFSFSINGSQCPQEVVCNIVASENTNGTVSIQVSASNIVLLSTLVSASVLNDTEMIMHGKNNNLTFTFQGINRSIKVFVDNETCALCESETTVIDVEVPPTTFRCICTSQQRCVNGTCQSIGTSVINANTVKLAFSASVSMVSIAVYSASPLTDMQ